MSTSRWDGGLIEAVLAAKAAPRCARRSAQPGSSGRANGSRRNLAADLDQETVAVAHIGHGLPPTAYRAGDRRSAGRERMPEALRHVGRHERDLGAGRAAFAGAIAAEILNGSTTRVRAGRNG